MIEILFWIIAGLIYINTDQPPKIPCEQPIYNGAVYQKCAEGVNTEIRRENE